MFSLCSATGCHGTEEFPEQAAASINMLQVSSNVTRMLNFSADVSTSVLQRYTSLLDDTPSTVKAVLFWLGVVWLLLVLLTLLFTSILPCLMGAVSKTFTVPEVEVTPKDDSEENVKQGNWLGSLVAKAIEAYDTKKAFGVSVKFGSIAVYASTGTVEICDLMVSSPDGYYSPLLVASELLVDIDMKQLIFSFGSDVCIEQMKIDGLMLTIEKTFRTSNLNDFLKFLSSKNQNLQDVKAEEKKEPETSLPPKSESRGWFSGLFSSKDETEKKDEKKRNMILRKVDFKNVGVNTGFYCLAGYGVKLRAGDLSWEDFDTEMCKDLGSTKVPLDVIPFLVMTLLRSILANVYKGDKLIEVVEQGVADACDEIQNSASRVNSTLADGVYKGAKKVGQAVTAGADVVHGAVDAGKAAVGAGSAAVSQAGATASSMFVSPGSNEPPPS